jgi:hypothetical protein
MSLTHILIDFENVKPTATDMKLIRGADYRVRIFHGPHQNKFDADIVKALQPLGDKVEYIQCERAGKNALDFHIAFYLGRMIPGLEIAAAPTGRSASFFIVSKDSGFDVLLGHIRELGYGAARVASVREALGVDEATDAAVTPEPAVKRALPKKAAAAKPVSTAEKTPTPRVQPAKQKAKAAAPQPEKVAKPDPWSRAIENLRDHPNNRPTTSKTLEHHLTALLGKEISPTVVKDLIARLQREGIAVAKGKKIEYKIPVGKK